MASSSSQTSISTATEHGDCRKINDAVYEVHRPAKGFIELEIVFFHGFQLSGCQDAYLTTWMVADGSACWLNTWLSEKYPQSRIITVSYDSNVEKTDTGGTMDMYLVGENLVYSIIELAQVGQSCPVVLVGHGVGGLVLKQVCCKAEELGTRLRAQGKGINPFDCFLARLKGAFFYSTPQSGIRVEMYPKRKRPSPLLDYYKLLSTHSARLNSDFSNLRRRDQYGWKTFGVIEANVTENRYTMSRSASPRSCKRSQNVPTVEEGSGRIDLDECLVLSGEDSYTICKPKERSSSSFQILLKFVQGILEREEWTMKNRQFLLQFPRVFLNTRERVEQVLDTLRLGEAEPSKVSLVGMGGIGKSTLAKELLVRIGSCFQYVCFVDDVMAQLKQHNLQSVIAENLFHGNGSKVQMQIQTWHPESLGLLLKGKKVLLILDNVDSEEQISTLLIPNWVEDGSRLVVTSRGKFMPSFVIYEVPFLNHQEAETLFRAHVGTEVVKLIPDDILQAVVAKCDGLPLTVEVIGSYLKPHTEVSVWKGVLESLRKAESISGNADDKLWAKLRVSFGSLAPREQRMFLDLAVFDNCEPNGLQYDVNIWKAIWSSNDASVVDIGLRNLVNKCFIVLCTRWYDHGNQYLALSSGAEFVRIHEQLRDMGRSIFRPSFEKIELCRGVYESKDVDELLSSYKGDDARTEALSVVSDSEKLHSWSAIGHLRELRLLRMINVGITGKGVERFPSNLAFFQMSGCSRARGNAWNLFAFLESKCWPIRTEDVGALYKLTVLLLENCSYVRFPENFHELKNLGILIISGEHLTNLPKKFGLLPSLRVLILKDVGLSKLPDSFLQLSSLQSLEVRGCSTLKALPDWCVPGPTLLVQDIQSPLCMLTRLRLENLPALIELPRSLGMCRKLEDLRILQCDSLECLGEPFGEFHSLSLLHIKGCRRLRYLPESLGQLKELRYLSLKLLGISTLPASLWNLHELVFLEPMRLEYFKDLPERVVEMDTAPNNGTLDLQRFRELPPPFRNLETLTIKKCHRLKSLPECLGQIDSLKGIYIEGERLERLPESLGLLRNLKHFDIHCRSLKSLPEGLGQIDSLSRICIEGESLERLPESLGLLRNLKHLDILCQSLKSLPEGLGQIDSLNRLRIEGESLERLPESLGLLKNLESLDINCRSLKSLPEGLGQIDSFNQICIEGESLERLPKPLGLLRNLKFLGINCRSLKSLPESLGQIDSLNWIFIEGESLERLPESLGLLRNLKFLGINCRSLKSLPESLGQIDTPNRIFIERESLERFPESLRSLKNLEFLDISCPSLKSLPYGSRKIDLFKEIWIENETMYRQLESLVLVKSICSDGFLLKRGVRGDCESLFSYTEPYNSLYLLPK